MDAMALQTLDFINSIIPVYFDAKNIDKIYLMEFKIQ